MDYQILAAELREAAYAGMSDERAADALNAVNVLAYRPVSVAALASAAYGMGLTVRLRAAIRDTQAPVELVAVCESLLDLLKAPFPTVDFFEADGSPDAATGAMLAMLSAAGLLSEAEVEQLQALAIVRASRASQLSLPSVTADDIAIARGWYAAQDVEAARLASFAALQERLVTGYHGALAWLAGRRASGQAAPEWGDVVGRM